MTGRMLMGVVMGMGSCNDGSAYNGNSSELHCQKAGS
jgi:hypothetical protein